MAAETVDYADKEQGEASQLPTNKVWSFGNANEVKDAVNDHAARIDLLQNEDVLSNPVPSIDFVPSLDGQFTHEEGRMFYDVEFASMVYMNDIADMRVNVGQELVVKVHNSTGVTIPNGTVVQYAGTVTGGVGDVILAQADTVENCNTVAVTTHEIQAGGDGYVTTVGVVHFVDTSAFSVADRLYVSSTVAGGLTNEEQEISSPVAVVLTSSVNDGLIMVRPVGIKNVLSLAQVSMIPAVDISQTGVSSTPTPINCYENVDRPAINVSTTFIADGNGYRAQLQPSSPQYSGIYKVTGQVSLNGSSNQTHRLEIYVNGVASGIMGIIDLNNNSTDYGSATIFGYTNGRLTDTDVVELYISKDGSGTSTVIYESLVLSIERIGII